MNNFILNYTTTHFVIPNFYNEIIGGKYDIKKFKH